MTVVAVDLDHSEADALIRRVLPLVDQMKVLAYRDFHSGHAVLYVRDSFEEEVVTRLRDAGVKAFGIQRIEHSSRLWTR